MGIICPLPRGSSPPDVWVKNSPLVDDNVVAGWLYRNDSKTSTVQSVLVSGNTCVIYSISWVLLIAVSHHVVRESCIDPTYAPIVIISLSSA